jgi:hypothetical protein
MQKVADLFTGFSLITHRRGRWRQATAVGASGAIGADAHEGRHRKWRYRLLV